MKRMINLYAEAFSLPFSYAFTQQDPILQAVSDCINQKRDKLQIEYTFDLEKKLDKAFLQTVHTLNQHTEILDLNELQSLMRHIYRASDIIQCAKQYGEQSSDSTFMQIYYINLLRKITDSMLTNRDGIAALRPWSGNFPSKAPFMAGLYGTNQENNSAFSPQRIELWNSVLRCLPEDLFISCYAAILADGSSSVAAQRENSKQILKSFGNSVHIADELLDRMLDQGMAETHLHANASRSFGLIWEDMLMLALRGKNVLGNGQYDLPYKQQVEYSQINQNALECAVIRLFLSAYLNGGVDSIPLFMQSNPVTERYRQHFIQQMQNVCVFGHPLVPFSSQALPGIPFLTRYPQDEAEDIWAILLLDSSLKFTIPTLAEKCFLSWSFIHIQQAPSDMLFTTMFLYYLRLRNNVYRCCVQDGKNKGLSYFQKYYDLSSDAGKLKTEDRLLRIFYTAMEDHRVSKTELRIAPRSIPAPTLREAVFKTEIEIRSDITTFIRQHLYTILLTYSQYPLDGKTIKQDYEALWRHAQDAIQAGDTGVLQRLLGSFGIQSSAVHSHCLGIIYHLIKGGESRELPSCFAQSDTSCEHQAYEKLSFGSARFSYKATIIALSNVRDICPEISRLIVGIDAASLEVPTEPWVFSSSFRLARKRNAILCGEQKMAENKALLGITYHVGEDFRHPLSGLRHIDEAIDLLNLRSGDRLGHALSLGIDLDRWFHVHGMAAMPVVEWMEDNLWLWRLISQTPELSDIAGYAKIIERLIYQCVKKIYLSANGITLENLSRAYAFKSAPIETVRALAETVRSHCQAATDCFKVLPDATFYPCWKEETTNQTWTEELLSMSYHCGFYKYRMGEVILVPTDEAFIAITKRIQRYMAQKVAQKGLIVETNPSSNAVIGDMDGILTHPIWQFRQSADCRVMSSINTDDPSVFSTTIANEYAQAYYTLRHHGLSTEEALHEVNAMREIGYRTSFIRRIPLFSELLQDYEHILYAFGKTPVQI